MTIGNSTITSSTNSPMIYVTNTTCQVQVTASTLQHPDAAVLLYLDEDRWGTAGNNGGHAEVTFNNCTLNGTMQAGSTSSATVALKEGTELTGTTSGPITVTQDTTSSWSS